MAISKEERNKIASALMGVDAFHLALGEFVAKFSETEALIQTVFWQLAGVQPPTAQAVFSGVRTDDAMGKITRISDAQKWSKPKQERKQHVFDQLKHINKLRNNILHYGAQLEGPDTWRVTNENFVHVPENVSGEVISPQTLKEAWHDLDTIDLLLLDMVLEGLDGQPDPDSVDQALKRAWQYKPPPQAVHRRKSRDNRPKQKRPRGSSRG